MLVRGFLAIIVQGSREKEVWSGSEENQAKLCFPFRHSVYKCVLQLAEFLHDSFLS